MISRSHKVSKPWDEYSYSFNHSKIGHTPNEYCCGVAFQINGYIILTTKFSAAIVYDTLWNDGLLLWIENPVSHLPLWRAVTFLRQFREHLAKLLQLPCNWQLNTAINVSHFGTIVTEVQPAEFILVSMKIYWHFLSFLNIDSVQVVGMLHCGGQGSTRVFNNSLAPGRSLCDFRNVIFNLALLIGILKSSYDNVLIRIPQDLTDDKSTLVQVMAWCHQATSHYLNQCWPRSPMPYGITRPQWVNTLKLEQNGWYFAAFSLYSWILIQICLNFVLKDLIDDKWALVLVVINWHQTMTCTDDDLIHYWLYTSPSLNKLINDVPKSCQLSKIMTLD